MRRLAFGLAMLAPATAAAVNGATPRTPPAFGEPPCLTVVDRSVDAVLHVAIGLPFEDAVLTEDELPDSRTLQLFATCRPERPGDRLPDWIATDDAQRSLDAMLIGELPAPADVLETATSWALGHSPESSCAIELVPAAARIPLTCAAVEPGVDWDTTGVPAGNYAIYGYTFEPAVNLWTRRAGVVQVQDGDPLPAVALASPSREATVYEESTVMLAGCAMGPQDTTVTLAWAPITATDLGDENAWVAFAEVAAAAAPSGFEVAFDPPPAAANQALVVRARAQDATGRAWTDVAVGTLVVLPGAGASDPPEGPLVPDACGSAAGSSESGGESSGGESSGGSEDATTDAADESASASACGCHHEPAARQPAAQDANRGRAVPMWLVFALGLRRRRRCAKVPGACTGVRCCVTDGSGWCSRTTDSSSSSRSS
jgi:hypothetical protein